MLRAAAAEYELQQPGRDAETEPAEGLQHHPPASQGGCEAACDVTVLIMRDKDVFTCTTHSILVRLRSDCRQLRRTEKHVAVATAPMVHHVVPYVLTVLTVLTVVCVLKRWRLVLLLFLS